MEFKDLERINEGLKTVPIKNKDYVEVPTRVLAFRELYPEGVIRTEMISCVNGVCTFKAEAFADHEALKPLATGHAYEKEGSSFINKTSYIENCETSAVGRALGFLGIGIDTSIASYEEVENAKANQNDSIGEAGGKKVLDALVKLGESPDAWCRKYKVETLADLTGLQQKEIGEKLRELKVQKNEKA